MIAPQEKSNWCWAAVTYSLGQYYQVQAATCQDQTAIAQALLKFNCHCRGKEYCHECNQPFFVAEALEYFGLLEAAIPTSISKTELITALTQQQPVVIATRWYAIGMGHLLTISKYRSDDAFEVWDSKKEQAMYLTYENLLSDEKRKIKWVNTFLTKESST